MILGVIKMPKKKLDLAEQVNLAIANNDMKEIEIIDKPDFEILTLNEYQAEKQLLAERRKAVVLRLDGRKLAQANKIMDAMDNALNKLTDPTTTAMDMNFLANAYDKLNKTLNTTIRLDTVDGSGKAARLALEVKFGNGTSVKTVIDG